MNQSDEHASINSSLLADFSWINLTTSDGYTSNALVQFNSSLISAISTNSQWILTNSDVPSAPGYSSSTLHTTQLPSFDQPAQQFNWWFLLLIVFIFAGGLGNVLVCLAICLERRLQNLTNYFLLSLAVADLIVSLVVMPFGVVNGFTGSWPLGAEMCNVYVTSDVLSCSSSIMHMCFISVGRYWGIRNPLKTRHHSKKSVMLKIVFVWFLSMVITSPITILGLVDERNIIPQARTCAINNKFFFIFGSLFAFYIPMVFMVIAYVLTVQLLRQQAKFGDPQHTRRLHLPASSAGNRLSKQLRSSTSSSSSSSYTTWGQHNPAQDRTSSDINNLSRAGSANNGHVAYGHHRTLVCDRAVQTDPTRTRSAPQDQRPPRFQLVKSSSSLHFKFLPQRGRILNRSIKTTAPGSVATEQKASKVLGLVFFTFVVCWTPFFILNVIFAACPSCPVSDRIVSTCLWLGYVSSTINPIIYTIFNRTFKQAFVRLLMCRCVGKRRRRWGPGIGGVSTGLLGGRQYSASEGLAHAPIKIIGCLRSPTFPPPGGSSYDHQDTSEC